MFHSFELFGRIARFRLPLIAALAFGFTACDNGSAFNAESSDPTVTTADTPTIGEGTDLPDETDGSVVSTDASVASLSFSGGIPIGIWAQPVSEYGSRYNGGVLNVGESVLRSTLASIKSQGGKAVLVFTGSRKYYQNSDGTFSMTKWQNRVDRYKGVNFDDYIKDGTVVGHLLVDEPNDPSNWGGKAISPSVVDQMGAYSKKLWPNLPTVVRTEPKYFPGNPKYVDAAWAQYLYRRGPVGDYIKKVTSDAQNRGLALVVGMNVLKGGNPNGTQMSATEVSSWGGTLLGSSYPCAFMSWTWNSNYLSTSSIKSAMDDLRKKAQNRTLKSCKGS